MAEKLIDLSAEQLIRAQMEGLASAIHSLSRVTNLLYFGRSTERYRLRPLKNLCAFFTLVIGAGRGASRSGHRDWILISDFSYPSLQATRR